MRNKSEPEQKVAQLKRFHLCITLSRDYVLFTPDNRPDYLNLYSEANRKLHTILDNVLKHELSTQEYEAHLQKIEETKNRVDNYR